MTACPAPLHQRSHGAAHVGLLPGPAGARLDRLHQAGSAKAFVHAGASGPEVVFLNTSGGPAHVTVRHVVGAGAHLDWLPQETILYDSSDLHRETTIDLAEDASCLMLEAVVLGRAAMGETLEDVTLRDTRRIMRAGRPVLIEPLHLVAQALTAGPAVLGGARAFATLALVAPGAMDAVGASGFDGKLVIRLMAGDGWPLKRQIMRLLRALRPGPLPRVWQN